MRQRGIIGLFVGSVIALVLSLPSLASAAVTPQPPDLVDSPIVITSYQLDGNQLTFVQLYNKSSDLIELHDWQLDYLAVSSQLEQPVEIALSGYIKPSSYIVLTANGSLAGSDGHYHLPALAAEFLPYSLSLQPPAGFSLITAPLDGVADGQRYDLSQTSAGNYTASSKYEPVVASQPLYGGGLYQPAVDTPLRIVGVMANARDCGPLDTKLDCFEFIKLHNASSSIVSLEDYRLRFGKGNDRSGIANTVHLSGKLAADSYLVVKQRDDTKPLAITASRGHIWVEDVYGLVTYPATITAYQDIGSSQHRGLAWSFDGRQWRWALATDGPNDFRLPPAPETTQSGLKPCRSDQERNPETNRCRLIAGQASALKPCRDDQYRSPETNRCRNLVSSASTLKPCRSDQYRHPDTNRCRLIAGASNDLKPCRANQERNPDTNRCRNIRQTEPPAAAFAVEPVQETASAFVGWWALGGLGLVAVGYGAWEWRSELLNSIKKIGSFFWSSK